MAISTIKTTGLMTVGSRKPRRLDREEEEQLSKSSGSLTALLLRGYFTQDDCGVPSR